MLPFDINFLLQLSLAAHAIPCLVGWKRGVGSCNLMRSLGLATSRISSPLSQEPTTTANGRLMVFVLDNYDSFTYNLVQYLGELGAEVVVRRNDQVTVGEIEAIQPKRILISPGPCTPQEAGISMDIFRHFTGRLPILGVCLGHQALGAAFGGQVIRAPHLMHGKTSQVTHDSRTVFKDLQS